MEKVLTFLKWLLYTAVFVLVFSFQSAYAGRMMLFGAKPDFLPLLVVCLSFLEGAKPGAVMGILAGVLCGAVTNLCAMYAPLFFASGYFSGYLSDTRVRTNLFTVTLSALVLNILCVLSRALAAYVFQLRSAPLTLLAEYGGCAIFTVAGACMLYPLCKLIHRISLPGHRRDRRMRYRL